MDIAGQLVNRYWRNVGFAVRTRMWIESNSKSNETLLGKPAVAHSGQPIAILDLTSLQRSNPACHREQAPEEISYRAGVENAVEDIENATKAGHKWSGIFFTNIPFDE